MKQYQPQIRTKKKLSPMQRLKAALTLFSIFYLTPFSITFAIKAIAEPNFSVPPLVDAFAKCLSGKCDRTEPMSVVERYWKLEYTYLTPSSNTCSDGNEYLCQCPDGTTNTSRDQCQKLDKKSDFLIGYDPEPPLECNTQQASVAISDKRGQNVDSCDDIKYYIHLQEANSGSLYKYQLEKTTYLNNSYPLSSKWQVTFNRFGKVIKLGPQI